MSPFHGEDESGWFRQWSRRFQLTTRTVLEDVPAGTDGGGVGRSSPSIQDPNGILLGVRIPDRVRPILNAVAALLVFERHQLTKG